ncbi:MAG TPA: ECF-type sigma factor [Chthoniobacterales bacterium]|jgi:RNA polymerase sigma-70 factor (ECF subfamily)
MGIQLTPFNHEAGKGPDFAALSLPHFCLEYIHAFPQLRPMLSNAAIDGAGEDDRFRTTRWSVVLLSADGMGDDEKAREALEHLCRNYWRPVVAFIAREGQPVQNAEDLAQEFFLQLLRRNFLQQATRERGRFRTLLRASVRNFLNDASSKTKSKKRGGDFEFVTWDEWKAEAPSQLSIPAEVLEGWSSEQVFDVRWAATVAERALRRLQDECEKRGRRRVFDVLSPYLTAERSDISNDALAQTLGVKSADVKNLLHRMRQRYRQLLRDEVAETVDAPEEVEDELRYLVKALAAGM